MSKIQVYLIRQKCTTYLRIVIWPFPRIETTIISITFFREIFEPPISALIAPNLAARFNCYQLLNQMAHLKWIFKLLLLDG